MTRLNLGASVLLALSLVLGIQGTAHAAKSYDNCTGFITSVPAVISTQGTWCLKQDLTTAIASGAAITIATNNVTLDCNDFKLGGLAAGLGTQANGIVADTRLNATVRHCNVRGFYYGLRFFNSVFTFPKGSHTVEDNRFDGNTFTGIEVYGDGSVIRRNRVLDTGGSTNIAMAAGISAVHSVDVLDNTVSNVFARSGGNGHAFGVVTDLNLSGDISGNQIRGLLKDGTGVAHGIDSGGSARLTMRNNDLVGDGSTGSTGLHCGNPQGQARDNVISGFAYGIIYCSDSGNVIAP